MSIQSHESSFSDIQGLPPLETVDFVAQAESLIQENQETADRRRARLIDYLVKDIGGYTLEQGEAIVSRLAIEKNPGWPLYDKGAWSELWHRWKELAPNRAATGNISSQFGRIRIPAPYKVRREELSEIADVVLDTLRRGRVDAEVESMWGIMFDTIGLDSSMLKNDLKWYIVWKVLVFVTGAIQKRFAQSDAVLKNYLESEMTPDVVLGRLDALFATHSGPPPRMEAREPATDPSRQRSQTPPRIRFSHSPPLMNQPLRAGPSRTRPSVPSLPPVSESQHSSPGPSGAPFGGSPGLRRSTSEDSLYAAPPRRSGPSNLPETAPRSVSLTRQLSGVTGHLRQPESPSPSGSPSRGRRRLRDTLAKRFNSVKGALSRSGSRRRDPSSNSLAHSRRLPLRYPAIYGDLYKLN